MVSFDQVMPHPDTFEYTVKVHPVKTHICKLPPLALTVFPYTKGTEGYCTECRLVWVLVEDNYGLEWRHKERVTPGKHWWNATKFEPVYHNPNDKKVTQF